MMICIWALQKTVSDPEAFDDYPMQLIVNADNSITTTLRLCQPLLQVWPLLVHLSLRAL